MDDTLFNCDVCKRTFVKARSDKEALEESKKAHDQNDWGKLEADDCVILCEDCYEGFIRVGSIGRSRGTR